MSNDIGKEVREGFLEALTEMGTLCDVAGESRKAIKTDDGDAATSFAFADEFAIKAGDTIRETATESYFAVIDARPISAAGSFESSRVRHCSSPLRLRYFAARLSAGEESAVLVCYLHVR